LRHETGKELAMFAGIRTPLLSKLIGTSIAKFAGRSGLMPPSYQCRSTGFFESADGSD
jgi:hypothetical protein